MIPKSKEKLPKGSEERPSSSSEDLGSGSGNATELKRRNATEAPSFAGLAADANSKPGHVSSKRSLESDPTHLTPPATKARESNTPGDRDSELNKSADVELTDDEVSVINDTNTVADPSVKGLSKVIHRMSLDDQQK